MSDLDYRFDHRTEEHDAEQLLRIRNFARDAELPDEIDLEIGTNRGRFLAQLAERSPERFSVGMEVREKYAEQAKRRLERLDIDNAVVLWADVKLALPIVFDDGQIADVFVLFPDPWWKRRHRKRRVIRPPTLDLLAQKMRPGGRLMIRTDVGPLADDMRDVLCAHEAFEPLSPDAYPRDPLPRSTRERYCVENELPIHALYYRKTATPSPPSREG